MCHERHRPNHVEMGHQPTSHAWQFASERELDEQGVEPHSADGERPRGHGYAVVGLPQCYWHRWEWSASPRGQANERSGPEGARRRPSGNDYCFTCSHRPAAYVAAFAACQYAQVHRRHDLGRVHGLRPQDGVRSGGNSNNLVGAGSTFDSERVRNRCCNRVQGLSE